MARSAVLAGRTLSDTVRNAFVVLLMAAVGYIVGFRLHAGPVKAFGAYVLVLSFGFAFSWISATIGLTVHDPEAAQTAGFIWIFPLTFASSVFVPVHTLPGWLQAFAKINPVTVTTNALRELTLTGSFDRQLLYSILWIVGILLVFVPLSVSRYRKVV
jgi:ABC-2 type transport system permease protein/oleandomycin transport system permease protein